MNTQQYLMKEQLYFNESLWRGKMFDGGWIESSGGQADDIEPATGSVLARVGVADATDILAAASKASVAQRDWREVPFLAERLLPGLVSERKRTFDQLFRSFADN
jgi:Aldehyde dehydrogenase family